MARDFLPYLRAWAELLDNRFVVPGTSIRFGLDPVLSLIPGIGDLASPVYTVALIIQGVRQRVPKAVLVRMMANALLDACIGAVPVAGNVADIFWRANIRNLELLDRHAQPGTPPRREDVLFAWGLAVGFGALVLVPVAIGIWLALLLMTLIGV